MKMLPGMNQYAGMLDEGMANDAMKHTKAIIQSMTPYERAHPEKLRGTMKKRIAAGSGTSVNDVNKLINQFSRVKKQMDQIGALSRSGSLNEESLERMMDNMQNAANDPQMQAQMRQIQQRAKKKKYRF
jgi:signal recognition particle subunit SRP54